MLESGDPAPDVSAQNQDGETITPDFADPTVVYFYPEDFTSGCTTEAAEFQSTLPDFEEFGVTIYGVSMDDVATHADFAEEDRPITDAERRRIFTPIGLSLGGDTPYQIAFSIVGELLAVANDRRPEHLSRREGPIHDRVELTD